MKFVALWNMLAMSVTFEVSSDASDWLNAGAFWNIPYIVVTLPVCVQSMGWLKLLMLTNICCMFVAADGTQPLTLLLKALAELNIW